MNFLRFLSQSFGALFSRSDRPLLRSYTLKSKQLNRKVKIQIYRPPLLPNRPCRLLLCLDGQDLPRMQLPTILADCARSHPARPLIVVGIYAGDRIQEYGTAGRPDYQGRGEAAAAHQAFILEQLLPWLEKRYLIRSSAKYRAVAGFSLGGLHAFDLAWHHPQQFGSVGVFSGALWWRSKAFNAQKPDADRIVHQYVKSRRKAPEGLRAWLMAGTEDETEDRNNNGIIDAIDDTIQLAALLRKRGMKSEQQLSYHEEEGGKHEPATWAKVMPDFLDWWLSV